MQHNQQQRQQQKDQSVQQAAAEALGSVQQQLQCKLIATDINPAALAATARTLAAHGVRDEVCATGISGLAVRIVFTCSMYCIGIACEAVASAATALCASYCC